VEDQVVQGEETTWTVAVDAAEDRLDGFIRRRLPTLSRKSVESAIAAGLFRVNGRRRNKGDKIRSGDIVSFTGPKTWLAEKPLPLPGLRVTILYEDSHLLVVDKPAGMDTHGFSGRHVNTVANFLAAERPEVLGVGKSRWEPGLVHRLDRDTSGVVLVAKTQSAFEALRGQFRRREIRKHYWALVCGITPSRGSISYPIAHNRGDKRRMRVIVRSRAISKQEKIWPARTRYRRLLAHARFSLLQIEMRTGVMHQIRVHLAAIGHPIVGDAIYGVTGADRIGLKRHFLHAYRLEFEHPVEQREIAVESPLPSELAGVLDSLKIAS
jgi:23S rRNA pseudouridine1911/1915/1917 synthase